MKKLYIIWALALWLLSTFMILNKVDAAVQNGNLTLNISWGIITCDFASWHDFGSINATDVFNQVHTMTWNLGTFYCQDQEWRNEWNLTIESNDLVHSTLLSWIWNITDIKAISNINTVTVGACSTGINNTTLVWINWAPQAVLVKSSALGEMCTIAADNVKVQLVLKQNQPVGAYSSTFTVTYPG